MTNGSITKQERGSVIKGANRVVHGERQQAFRTERRVRVQGNEMRVSS